MADNSKKYPVRGVTKSGVETEKLLEKMIRDHADLSAQQATQNGTYDTDITNINTSITTINTDITNLKAAKPVLLNLSGYTGGPGAYAGDLLGYSAISTLMGAELFRTMIYIPTGTTALKIKIKAAIVALATACAINCGGQTVSALGTPPYTNVWLPDATTGEFTISGPTVGWQELDIQVAAPGGSGTFYLYGIVVRAN